MLAVATAEFVPFVLTVAPFRQSVDRMDMTFPYFLAEFWLAHPCFSCPSSGNQNSFPGDIVSVSFSQIDLNETS